MEAVGATAALIEILKLLRAAIEFCQSFRDSPGELQQLANRFRLLETEVELFRLLTGRSRHWLHSNKKDHCLLNQYIHDAGQALRYIQSDFAKEARNATLKNRLRWSLYGKVKADLLLQRLAGLESSMNLVMSIFSKIQAKGKRVVSVKSDLSMLVARAQQLNAHRLRSGRPNQMHLLLASPANNDSLTPPLFHMQGLSEGGLASSTATQVIAEVATAANSESLLHHSKPLAPTGSLLRLRLKNTLLHRGLTTRSKAGSDPVPYAAPIMAAAREGNIQLLRRILRADRSARYCCTIDKLSPMGVAIQHGQASVVQLLLDNKVDMNAHFGRFETTALGQALRCRQFGIAKSLVERGASFSSRNISGWSPIFYLWAAEINPSASQYVNLLRRRPDFPLLHEEVYDVDGWGVMHRAACFGTADDVELLIRYGANPFDRIRPRKEQTECDDWTVLHVAAWYGARASVQVLSLHYVTGPGIDVTDSDGCTPLHLAVLRRQLSIAAILLRQGADPLRKTGAAWQCATNSTAGRRYNAVMLAAEVGRDFQQQFGALISDKVHTIGGGRSELRQVPIKVTNLSTTSPVVKSKSRWAYASMMARLLPKLETSNDSRNGSGCRGKFLIAFWLVVCLVAFRCR